MTGICDCCGTKTKVFMIEDMGLFYCEDCKNNNNEGWL